MKPENLLLADTPQGLMLKIADFGLSALLTGEDADSEEKPTMCVSNVLASPAVLEWRSRDCPCSQCPRCGVHRQMGVVDVCT